MAAGLYALAYTMGSGPDVPHELQGKTIISYRGTDNPSIFASGVSGGADITLGWLAGAGNPIDQTTMAIEFFKAVRGNNENAQDIIVNGHSLGGGLARS